MFDRDFEMLLLEQVRRESAMYYGIMIALGGCGIACIVMAVAAPIVFGLGAAGISIKLLILVPMFAVACYGTRSAACSSREAVEEMAYGLEHPDCNIPEDYMDETKAARRIACRNLHSIWGLIISYGIIALMLWAATVLLAFLAEPGKPGFSPMFLFASFVTFSIALALTILTIAYIRDIPAARRYRQFVDRGMDGE